MESNVFAAQVLGPELESLATTDSQGQGTRL